MAELALKPETVFRSPEGGAERRFLRPDELNACPGNAYRTFPLVLDATALSPDLAMDELAAFDLGAGLRRYGAVLFRGFPIGPRVDDVLAQLDDRFSNDSVGSQSLRKKLSSRTATSTAAPTFFYIPQHCEWNYNGRFPNRIAFFCDTPPEHDGSTVIANNREVTRQLPRAIVDKLAGDYVYEFSFTSEYSVSDILDYFGANNMTDARARMRELGFFMPDQTRQLIRAHRSCFIRHPETLEPLLAMPLEFMHRRVFRNGAASIRLSKKNRLPHFAKLMLAELMERFGKRLLSSRITLPSGRRLSRREYQTYLNILNSNKVYFRWQQNDLLVIDNYLATHGKQPHTGERKIVISLGSLLDRDALAIHEPGQIT